MKRSTSSKKPQVSKPAQELAPTRGGPRGAQRRKLLADERVQIKPYRGRAKWELYVHAETLRSWLKSHSFAVPNEDFREPRLLAKKLIFRQRVYGEFLQELLARLERCVLRGDSAEVLQSALAALTLELAREFRLDELDEENRTSRLPHVYARALEMLQTLGW